MDRPTRGSPQRPDRIIMAELNPTQKALLENARGRVEQARMNLEGAEHMYKELVGMAMPVGCNGFDPQAGIFYYEAPAPVQVVEEEGQMGERHLTVVADEAETDYEGSADNAHAEGAEHPLGDTDED